MTTTGPLHRSGSAAAPLRIGYVVEQPLHDMPEDLGHRIYVLALARALGEAGHEVVFVNRDWDSMLRIDASALTDEGGRSRACVIPGWWNRVHRGRNLLRRWSRNTSETPRFAAACAEALAGVDIIHDHFGMLQAGALWAARRLGVPYVLHVHSDDLAERLITGRDIPAGRRAVMEWTSRANFHAADAIVAVSPVVADALVETWGVERGRIHVLDNAVEESFFFDDEKRKRAGFRMLGELGLTPAHRLITFLGSFHVWYDLPLLIRAFAAVHRAHPEARLMLAGDGALQAEVLRLRDELGLADCVLVPGCIAHEKVPALLAASRVSVVPVTPMEQPFWCSPMKIFESLAVAVPVVATSAGVIPQLLRGGELGRLVAPGDEAAMAAALEALLDDDEEARRLGIAGRESAHEYTWARYAERLTDLYRRVLAGDAAR